jgi:hypothetical protein
MKRFTKGEPLSEDLVDQLRHLVDERGELAVLKILGISRPTLGRACGHLGLYAGTRALIEQRLAQQEGAADAR